MLFAWAGRGDAFDTSPTTVMFMLSELSASSHGVEVKEKCTIRVSLCWKGQLHVKMYVMEGRQRQVDCPNSALTSYGRESSATVGDGGEAFVLNVSSLIIKISIVRRFNRFVVASHREPEPSQDGWTSFNFAYHRVRMTLPQVLLFVFRVLR